MRLGWGLLRFVVSLHRKSKGKNILCIFHISVWSRDGQLAEEHKTLGWFEVSHPKRKNKDVSRVGHPEHRWHPALVISGKQIGAMLCSLRRR